MIALHKTTGRAIAVVSLMTINAVALALLPSPGVAQDAETLLGGSITSGGFGGPTMAFTNIHGEFATLFGGRGGWILNHSFVLGGAGYGMFTPNIRTGFSPHGSPPALRLGYGGVEVAYIHRSNELVHPGARLLLGAGGVTYESMDGGNMPSDGFFVAEPALGAQVNIVRWLRLDAGGSYRFVSGVTLPGVRDAQVSGFSGTLALAFGRF